MPEPEKVTVELNVDDSAVDNALEKLRELETAFRTLEEQGLTVSVGTPDDMVPADAEVAQIDLDLMAEIGDQLADAIADELSGVTADQVSVFSLEPDGVHYRVEED